jgi:hypothetical protein
MILGAGTILDVAQAKAFHAAGAAFLVAPHLDEEVGKWCAGRDLAWCPGTGTVTEMIRADRLGASIWPTIAQLCHLPNWSPHRPMRSGLRCSVHWIHELDASRRLGARRSAMFHRLLRIFDRLIRSGTAMWPTDFDL